MRKLSIIIAFVNQSILAGLSGKWTATSKLYGVAKTVQKSDTVWMPLSVANDDTQIKWIGIDDTNPLSCYHKVISWVSNNSDKQTKVTVDEIKMQMFIYGNSARTKMNLEDTFFAIKDGIPFIFHKQKIEEFKLRSLRIEGITLSNDSVALYAQEYKSQSRLKPNEVFFAVSYTIRLSYNQDCLDC